MENSTQELVASLMSQKQALNFEVTPPLSIREYMAHQIKNSKTPLVHYMTHESAGWINYMTSSSKTLEREGCVLAQFHSCPLDVIRQVGNALFYDLM